MPSLVPPDGLISRRAAAAILNVSVHRVICMSATGAIRAVVAPGFHALLFDEASVRAAAAAIRLAVGPIPAKPDPAPAAPRRLTRA